MRLTTWNVNGIRNPFSYPPWNATDRSFSAMFDILEADIVVMQELKIQRKDLRDDMVLVNGWDCYFSLPKHKKGYSGVGIYTRTDRCAPIRAEEGVLGVLPSPTGTPYRELPDEQSIGGYLNAAQIADISELGEDLAALDAEGRCVVLEFPAFVLFGVYSPANSNGLREDFRHGFVCALHDRIRNLVEMGKNVVLVGDLNVTRHEVDSAPSQEEIRKGVITHEDFISSRNRRMFNHLLVDGEVIGARDQGKEKGVLWDTTRMFHPGRTGMYTHWEVKINARPGNYGSRIDFVLVSDAMKSWLKDGNIQEGLLGSDHCPVYVEFNDEVITMSGTVPLADIMSPPGVFQEGERKIEWKIESTPLFSAKRMPEFDRRRTIKSMFAAPMLKKPPISQPLPTPIEPALTADTTASIEVNLNARNSSIAAPSLAKRKTSDAGPTVKPQTAKRSKPDASTRGQQSLKGFFKAKTTPWSVRNEPAQVAINDRTSIVPPVSQSEGDTLAEASDGSQPGQTITPTSTPLQGLHLSGSQQTPERARNNSPDPSPRKIASQIAASQRTQQKWGALFSKPVAPLCESHAEPCRIMQTKKKGGNQGRSFWMCARPLGPSGEKERGTEWRCGTFIWCSDWQSGKEDGGGSATGQGKGNPVEARSAAAPVTKTTET